MAISAAARTAQNNGALKNGKPASIFDLDAYQAEAVKLPFTFTLAGTVFTMPHMSDLDWQAVTTADGTPDPEVLVHTLMRAGLGKQWEAFRKAKLSAGGWNELWKRWQEHSGTDPGESGASPAS